MDFDPQQICDFLRPYADDPAMRAGFIRKFPELYDYIREIAKPTELEVEQKAFGEIRNFPAFDDMAALQIGFFDNNPQKYRWGANIKAWTGDNVANFKKPDFNANVTFWPAKRVKAEMKKVCDPKRKRPVSDATAELVSYLMAERPTSYLGLMRTNPHGLGTLYFGSICQLDVEGDKVKTFEIVSDAAYLDCSEGWSERDAGGGRLTGKASEAYRASSLDELDAWATAPLTQLDITGSRAI